MNGMHFGIAIDSSMDAIEACDNLADNIPNSTFFDIFALFFVIIQELFEIAVGAVFHNEVQF
jgi:hypothetical protein